MSARSCLGVFTFLALVALAGCGRDRPSGPRPSESGPAPVQRGGEAPISTPDNPDAQIGKYLYDPKGEPAYPPPPAPGTDPIVIPNCIVSYEDRLIVSSQVDGNIELVATPMHLRPDGVWEYKMADGTVITHDPAKFDPKSPHPRVEFSPREKIGLKDNPEKWVPYFKLRDGDHIAAEQVLCRLDDSLYITREESAKKVIKAAAEGMSAAEKGVQLTKEKIDLYKNNIGAISRAEILSDQTTLTRFVENLAQSQQAIAKAEADLREAQIMLTRHLIKSQINGIIRHVAKRGGEFARAGEKIFEIQSTEKVRLEGSLDVQYFDRVRRDMVVTVEPAVPSAAVKSHAQHPMEVTGVAVSGHPDRPLVVSVGLDHRALVWDPNLANEQGRLSIPHNLPHKVPVRCVACTPPTGKGIYAITGADDGRIRIWDLADPNRLPTTAREPADFHSGPVTAIAVSPDGRFAATAAGREVFLWELATGRKLYTLPPEHRDTVTSLRFTPQARLVTASKDRTIKVWRVGEEKAAVARTIDHRSGVLDSLGVSPDGGRILFDQDKGRIDLMSLSDGQTVGQLTNIGPSVAFANLAAFAPHRGVEGDDPYLIVTAGGEGDLKGGLQVWQAPRGGGRGSEIARLITHGRSNVTSVAFSPHKDKPFLVAGTAAGSVHVWTPPSGPAQRIEGRITHIDSADPRYVTVRVEMSNKGLGLLDRSAATVIVNPGQQ
jgi:WD40 repeat protein